MLKKRGHPCPMDTILVCYLIRSMPIHYNYIYSQAENIHTGIEKKTLDLVHRTAEYT